MSFEEAQTNLLESIDLLNDQSSIFVQILSSEEFAGQLGLSEPLASNTTRSQIERKVKEVLNRAEKKIESAETHPELVLALAEVVDEFQETDVELKQEYENSDIPNSLIVNMWRSREFLEELGEITNIPFYDMTLAFAQDLEEQDQLKNAMVIFLDYFAQSSDDATGYINVFLTRVSQSIGEVLEISDNENFCVKELVEIYRDCGTYFEHALPPLLSIIYYLEEEQIEYDKISNMNLHDGVQRIQKFDPLADFGSNFDSDIRNSVSHGGDSGYKINNIKGSVIFRYRKGGSTETKELSHDQFKQHVIRSYASAVALFLLPAFLITFCMYTNVLDASTIEF